MKVSKFVREHFRAAEPSGGGGAAIMEPPAAPDIKAPDAKQPVAKDSVEKDPQTKVDTDKQPNELDDFQMPSLDGLDDPPIDPKAGKPDPKVDAKDGKKKDAAPDPKKDPPAKQLRDELDSVKKERDDWKTKFESHPRVKELDDVVKTRETELETLKAENEDMRRQLTMHDPAASEKVQTLVKQFDSEFAAGIEAVPALETQYRSLLGEFVQLPRDDRAKYQEALTEFEARVEEVVGERKTEAALALIRRGAKFISESAAARKEVSENGSKFISEARAKEYDGAVKTLSDHLAGAFEVDDTFAQAESFHPLNFVRNARAALEGEAKIKDQDYDKKLDEYFRFASNGPSPKTLAELDALPPAEKASKLQGIQEARLEAAKVIRQRAKRAFYYEPYLSALIKENASMKEQLQKHASAAPGDPTKRVGESDSSDDPEQMEREARAQLAKL